MGNREALLAGAKRCLYEKGFARTTARDVTAASGVSLAAIGYHFGSLEALLNAAMLEAIEEWGEELARVFPVTPGGDPIAQLEGAWSRVIASLNEHRPLWVASFESLLQAERSPALRENLATGHQLARSGLAASLLNKDEAVVSEEEARAVGSFQLALLSGLIVQWLLDPERAPSAHDLGNALRTIAAVSEAGDSRTEARRPPRPWLRKTSCGQNWYAGGGRAKDVAPSRISQARSQARRRTDGGE